MRGIKNRGEGGCRRLAETQENPFIRRGTEARKSPFKVHSGGSSPESSGYELHNSLVSRGGWRCGICCRCPGPLAALVPRWETPTGSGISGGQRGPRPTPSAGPRRPRSHLGGKETKKKPGLPLSLKHS